MGNLTWHEWASLLGLTSAMYALWAGFWGLFYRKFFWDMIDGTIGPAGILPGPNSAVFDIIIVQIPVVQIVTMVLATCLVLLELAPLDAIKKTFAYRSFMFKAAMYFGLSFQCMLFYQGINAGLYSLITVLAYTRAQVRGECVPEVNANKGRSEAA